MGIVKESRRIRQEIRKLGKQSDLEVEFSPFGSTMVTFDEKLIVHAPYYPFIGQRALRETVEVLEHEYPIIEKVKAAEERLNSGEDI